MNNGQGNDLSPSSETNVWDFLTSLLQQQGAALVLAGLAGCGCIGLGWLFGSAYTSVKIEAARTGMEEILDSKVAEIGLVKQALLGHEHAEALAVFRKEATKDLEAALQEVALAIRDEEITRLRREGLISADGNLPSDVQMISFLAWDIEGTNQWLESNKSKVDVLSIMPYSNQFLVLYRSLEQ